MAATGAYIGGDIDIIVMGGKSMTACKGGYRVEVLCREKGVVRNAQLFKQVQKSAVLARCLS